MTTSGSDLNPRQHVADALRQLRIMSGKSTYTLAGTLGMAQSRVSRIENGHAIPTPSETRRWALECGASQQEAAALEHLAAEGTDRTEPWQTTQPGGIVKAQRRVGDREHTAGTIRSFQPSLIPGLLQTADYIRALFTLIGVPGTDLDAALQARVARQAVLLDQAKTFEFVLTEGALSWRPGSPQIQQAQLRQLGIASNLPNVQLRVLPYDIQAPAPYEHKFALYEDRDGGEPDLVETETVVAEITSTRPGIVRGYQARLDRLRTAPGILEGDTAGGFLWTIARGLS